MLNTQFGKIGIDINSLPLRQIDQIASQQIGALIGFDGSIEQKMLWANDQVKRTIRNELTQSIIQGEDMQRATARVVKSIEGITFQKARVVARTEIQKASNEVARATYLENQDVLKGVQWSSALDNRVCVQCASLSDRTWKFKNGELDAPQPPAHPHCRCVLIPLTFSWKELGARIPPAKHGAAKAFTGNTLKGHITYG